MGNRTLQAISLNLGLTGHLQGSMGLAMVALVGGAIAPLMLTSPAHAGTLTQWSYDPATQTLRITVPQGTTPHHFLLAEPARIVLDLPNTTMGAVNTQQVYDGPIYRIRVSQFQPDLTRIVMELSPDAVLAPEQVELQQSADSSWALRPVLASDPGMAPSPVPTLAAVPTPPPPLSAVVPPLPEAATPPGNPAPPFAISAPDPLPPLEPGAVEIPIQPPPIEPGAVEIPIQPPPIEPGAVEIPVQLPPMEPEAIEIPIQPPLEATVEPPVETSLPTFPAPPAPTSTVAIIPPPSEVTETLPPAVFPENRSVTVTVPSLANPLEVDSTSASGLTSPLERPVPSVSRPSADIALPPSAATSLTAASGSPLTFGEPFPDLSNATIMVDESSILLPSGTVLSLRYPRDTSLRLEAGIPWQEVLVLSQAVRDPSGNILIPEGSQVIGRFEPSLNGSQFIAQAITIQGRNLPLNAMSREVQPVVIQPNQIVEVRVTEDLPR